MFRKILASTIVCIAFLQAGTIVFAQTTLSKRVTNEMQAMEANASKSADKQNTELQTIITRADTMVTSRVTSLANLQTRIQNDNRLTTDEKSTLTTDIQTTITGLNTLKTKIDADTDAATARADTKEIVTSYYVYAVFEPKERLLIMLNNLQTVVTKLQTLTPQLTTLVATLTAQGKDTAALTPLIDDINTQLQAMSTTITADITKVQSVPLTPEGKTTLMQVRDDIKMVIKTDFQLIRTDLTKLRSSFQDTIKSNATMHDTNTSTNAAQTVTSTPSADVSPTE